jgi:hypothetical protein
MQLVAYLAWLDAQSKEQTISLDKSAPYQAFFCKIWKLEEEKETFV